VPKPRPIGPERARHSLIHRIAPRVDRARQYLTRFGLRPYRVELVWVRWSGEERGDGEECEIPGGRIEILPTPKVKNLDAVAYRFFSGGVLPVGSILVSQISALYTQDQLTGLALPTEEFTKRNDPPTLASSTRLPRKPSANSLPEPYDFFWEVREDGRGDDPSARNKFRLAALPMREAGAVDWSVILERVSNDENRDGTLNSGFDSD
jgi:hypothetical protein